jgi:hypothetical protein
VDKLVRGVPLNWPARSEKTADTKLSGEEPTVKVAYVPANGGQWESRKAGLITDSPATITSTELEKRDGFSAERAMTADSFWETPRAFLARRYIRLLLVAKINSLQAGAASPDGLHQMWTGCMILQKEVACSIDPRAWPTSGFSGILFSYSVCADEEALEDVGHVPAWPRLVSLAWRCMAACRECTAGDLAGHAVCPAASATCALCRLIPAVVLGRSVT